MKPLFTRHAIGSGLLAALFVCGTAIAEGPKEFWGSLSDGTRFEVKASEIALENSTDPNVLAFAQQVLTDNTSLLQSFKRGIGLRHGRFFSNGSQDKLGTLKDLTGNPFDRAYISMIVADHYVALHKLENQASGKKNRGKFHALIGEALTVVKAHLAAAITIQEGLPDTDTTDLETGTSSSSSSSEGSSSSDGSSSSVGGTIGSSSSCSSEGRKGGKGHHSSKSSSSSSSSSSESSNSSSESSSSSEAPV